MCFIAYEEYSDEITESQNFINPHQTQYGPEVLFYENWESDTNKNHETQLMKWASNIYNYANKAIP